MITIVRIEALAPTFAETMIVASCRELSTIPARNFRSAFLSHVARYIYIIVGFFPAIWYVTEPPLLCSTYVPGMLVRTDPHFVDVKVAVIVSVIGSSV